MRSAIQAMRQRGELVAVDKVRGRPVYELRAPHTLPIFEQCRQNWQGYRIHKVFGAAGRVTA